MSTLHVRTELPFEELLNAVENLNIPDLDKLVSQVITLQARRKAPSLPKNESELLQKINQGLPKDVQERFDILNAKRQSETINAEELQEFINLTNIIEQSDAKRVEYMVELANSRKVSLSALMKSLDFQSTSYAG